MMMLMKKRFFQLSMIGLFGLVICFLAGKNNFILASEIATAESEADCIKMTRESDCSMNPYYCKWNAATKSCQGASQFTNDEGGISSTSTSSGGGCVETALGCIPYDTNEFATWLLKILFGISGGIAFLLMVYGFILMATSSGDEKKVQGARETITSAIIGLLVSIFALFIFRLIAVDILMIPGLG